MNGLAYTALVHRITLTILVLVCVCAGIGAAPPTLAAPVQPPAKALVYVPEMGDSTRVAELGLPVYARLNGRDGPYLLVGAYSGAATGDLTGTVPDDLGRLAAVGLTGRVLDPDMTGATYYLAYPAPGRPIPFWRAYGHLLLDDGQAVLLRAAPSDAERLAADGADIVLITLTPKPLQPTVTASFLPITEQDPLIRSMIDQVSQTKLQQYVGDLSGEWPAVIGGSPYTIATRHTDSGIPVQKATQYIGEHLGSLGLAVESHQWHQTRPPNVIGQITGETPSSPIFLIGAHLDDMPAGPTAPGADDNASGSAAVLVAADILSQYRWGCTLRFAFWTGEEQGLLGSAAYAQRAYTNGEAIAGVLNLDMIGWNTPGSTPDIDLHARSSVPGSVELADLFASVVATYDLDLVPQVIPNGATASDHYYFWTYGYPAILGIEDYYGTGDFNGYYHQTTDKLDKFDMSYFTDFVKASVGAAAHMSGCLLKGNVEENVTYLPTITSGSALPPGGTPTRNLMLQAAPPVAP